MYRRDAFQIGCDRGGAPILLLLWTLQICLPDPTHVGLVEPGALAEALPGRAVAVGRVDAVDQQLEFERALARVAQRERRGERQIGAGGVAAHRNPVWVDAEARALARGELRHRDKFLVRDREFDLRR